MSQEMQGMKRDHNGQQKEEEVRASPFMPMFEGFRDELDEHHDRRERIIKASRDITATSKKIIFALQRVKTLNKPIPPKIASEVNEKKATIYKAFESIAPDLVGLNAWRYQRNISGGIQELIEALSFEHYLTQQTLISPTSAVIFLPPDSITLTSDDYVLGLFDLVGELMRFAITTMATTGKLPGSVPSSEEGADGDRRDILTDLRQLKTAFEALDTSGCGGTGLGRDVEKKMQVMGECVQKVEMAVYGMIIRGRERPKGWVPDLATEDRGAVESY